MKTTAIQIIPVIAPVIYRSAAGSLSSIIPQPQGPTKDTTGWAVYLRKKDGTAEWFADTGSEDDAMFIGRALVYHYDVWLEPQPWVDRRVFLDAEMTDAWVGQGSRGEFDDWLRDMAADPNGTLQLAAQDLMVLKGLK